jgi:anti-anti-sigma regulatory factor
MQETNSTPIKGTRLQGEWVTSEVAERLRLLAKEFDLLLAEDPRPASFAMDMAGITSLDACCCQLLAVFLGNLKRIGVTPELGDISPEMSAQISLLGFDEAFAPSGGPVKENL